jgi:hypothetical protein
MQALLKRAQELNQQGQVAAKKWILAGHSMVLLMPSPVDVVAAGMFVFVFTPIE